jgi:hypothetical protein
LRVKRGKGGEVKREGGRRQRKDERRRIGRRGRMAGEEMRKTRQEELTEKRRTAPVHHPRP